MKPPPCLREQAGEIYLALKVQPRASRTEIAGLLGGELKLKVTAPPVDSAANEAVTDFLAAQIGCPRRDVVLVKGHASTHKTVVIRGVPLAVVASRLGL